MIILYKKQRGKNPLIILPLYKVPKEKPWLKRKRGESEGRQGYKGSKRRKNRMIHN